MLACQSQVTSWKRTKKFALSILNQGSNSFTKLTIFPISNNLTAQNSNKLAFKITIKDSVSTKAAINRVKRLCQQKLPRCLQENLSDQSCCYNTQLNFLKYDIIPFKSRRKKNQLKCDRYKNQHKNVLFEIKYTEYKYKT